MNRILLSMEGKADIKINLMLKFENKMFIKFLDYVEFENFEPGQISIINY